jgi:predicted phage terminase large subunit-like protein
MRMLGAKSATRAQLPDGTIELRKAVELPLKFDQSIQSWDMTFKGTKNSDYVVGQVLAAVGADRYVLDQIRDRMDMPQTLGAVRRLSGQWPAAHLKLVEDKANGPAVIQSLRHEIGGFVEVNPEGGKMSRASAASPQLESGNWHIPHPQIRSWVEGFIAECAAFPAGAHDDQVDAWSQGALRLLHNRPKRPRPSPLAEFPYRGERGWMI